LKVALRVVERSPFGGNYVGKRKGVSKGVSVFMLEGKSMRAISNCAHR